MTALSRPSKSDTWLLLVIIAFILFLVCSCDQAEQVKPFPLDIEPIEGTQLFTIYRSEPIDVTFYNYWTDATYLLNFRCYDEERGQEWCVVGWGEVCVGGECRKLGLY